MEHNWVLYIAAFSTAFAVSNVFTPIAKTISMKVGAIDYPKARGMHQKPMPRMGGLAIVIGFMFTVLLLYRFVEFGETRKLIGFMIGATMIVVLGMFDDIYDLRARFKFFVQILAALVAIMSGIQIHVVMWPVTKALTYLSVPITLLWIVGVTNAVNLIDGLDGLAGGVTMIVAAFFTIICIAAEKGISPCVSAAVVGALLAFLVFNAYPAKVFMGDTGSLALGGFVAGTAYMMQMPLYIIIVGFIYLVEVISVILQVTYFKKTGGKRLFKMAPIHHHFELCGWSETRVVAVFSIVTAILCLIALMGV